MTSVYDLSVGRAQGVHQEREELKLVQGHPGGGPPVPLRGLLLQRAGRGLRVLSLAVSLVAFMP